MPIVNAKPATSRNYPMPNVFPILKAVITCAVLINARAAMPIRTRDSLQRDIPPAWTATVATGLFRPLLVPRSTAKPIHCKGHTRPWPATSATRSIHRQRCAYLPIHPRPARPVIPIRTVRSSLSSCAMTTAPHAISMIPVRSGSLHTGIREKPHFSSERDIGRRNAGNAMSGRKMVVRLYINPRRKNARPAMPMFTGGSSVEMERQSAPAATIQRSNGLPELLSMTGMQSFHWRPPMLK